MVESVQGSLKYNILAEAPSLIAMDKNDITLLTGDYVLVEHIEESPPVLLATGEHVSRLPDVVYLYVFYYYRNG